MKGDRFEINSNKRKFIDEVSDTPAPKHTCLDNNIQSRYNQESAEDSNSLFEDADSIMSVFNDENIKAKDTSSVNWSGTNTNTNASVNSFDTKTSSDYEIYDSPTNDDDMNEFSTLEYTKQLQDEASLENLFCSTGVVSNNFVLSSGRWNVNQDIEQGTEKLTIDKEFELYFSKLML